MASLCKDKNGRKRILFVAGDGSRKTIRLGKTSIKQAESFKIKLEALIAGRFSGSIEAETARWVAGLPDDIHGRLAAVGLVNVRAAMMSLTLGQFLNEYTQSRSDVKLNTQIVYGRTCKHLIKHFGPKKLLPEITPGDADAWRLYLVRHGLAENTIRRTCGIARQFFRAAKRRKLIAENPFAELKVTVRGNKGREYFLDRQDAEKILEACPDAQWRLIFGLARWGGLRCPSEVLRLQWQDIDFEHDRFIVHASKTEHHEDGGVRTVPIFPELRPLFQDTFDQAQEGDVYCITRYRPYVNLCTQMIRIAKQAGLSPWPKIFQNLRSTQQTELMKDWPEYVVCKWLGNSRRIAREHYLQVTEEHFRQAAHNAAQYPAALNCKEQNDTPDKGLENAVLPLVTAHCDSVHESLLGDTGLEPVTSCV
jgi:integrase